jgi:hypothetical protein
MNSRQCIIESLEAREFFCTSPLSAAGVSSAHVTPAVVHKVGASSPASAAKVVDFLGTATNQSGQTSKIKITLTTLKGVHEGVIYVHNNTGGTTPISFTVASNLTFSFSFQVGDQSAHAVGNLSPSGTKITAAWTSVSSTGQKGYGSVVAKRV